MLLRSALIANKVSLHCRTGRGEIESGRDETDGVEYLIEECAVLGYFERFPFALFPLQLFGIWGRRDSAPFDPVLPRTRQACRSIAVLHSPCL